MRNYNNFKDLTVKSKENINYKALVAKHMIPELEHKGKITYSLWMYLFGLHVQKSNYIVNGEMSLPLSRITQEQLFESQKTKHIDSNSEISVISSIPLFFADYLEQKHFNKLLIIEYPGNT